MNNIEQIIVRLKTRVALAELIGPDEMIVSASDLSALIAQLEAAQKERDELKELNCHFDLSIRKTEGVNEVLRSKLEAAERALIRPLPIGELVHRLEGQTYEKWFSESDVKDLRERAQKAESAANEKLKGDQVPMFLKQTGIGANSCQGSYKEYVTIEESEYEENPTKHLKLFTAPQKPVVLPRVAAIHAELTDVARHRTSVENIRDVVEAIKAAGGKVEGGDNG